MSKLGRDRIMSKSIKTPLWEKLQAIVEEKPVSFHVPGHKNGTILPNVSWGKFREMMRYDLTELPGLDDLHQPETVIEDALALARDFFGSRETYFLVNGSTVGNLAMILQAVSEGDYILVPKNVHKSVVNALELSKARPIFIDPAYDETLNRVTVPLLTDIQQAFTHYPIKAMIITYPDYYGTTFDLEAMIRYIHARGALMLVDEAHGVHLSLNYPYFPSSSLSLGADFVVQSAHKMAPALTQTAYLHVSHHYKGETRCLKHYLQMLQSSSPSYLLMASLDVTRAFLASQTTALLNQVMASVKDVRSVLSGLESACLIKESSTIDPLKITLQPKLGYTTKAIEAAFRTAGVYLEFITDQDLVFVHGLAPFTEQEKLQYAVNYTNHTLKKQAKHDTMKIVRKKVRHPLTELVCNYQTLASFKPVFVSLNDAINCVAYESIIPYPPGIPLVLKGQRITSEDIDEIRQLLAQKIHFQNNHITQGVYVIKEI